MPGITMVGTAPVFYSIPVSPQLLEALVTSTFPKEETVVLRFVPPVANKETYFSEGMRPLANRHIVLQCFEAFKASMVCLFHFDPPTISHTLGAQNVMQSEVAPQAQR